MAPLPSPVRAALGLAATMLDEAKTLPDKAIEVPMLVINRALKFSLRAQQRYSSLAARGDELLAGRRITDEAPEWAKFDDRPDDADAQGATSPDVSIAADADGDADVDSPAPGTTKRVNAPRTGAPSAFDSVVDEG